MYPQLAPLSGAREIRVPLNDAYEHDLEAMATEITAATQLVLVCNPNNPTGTSLPAAEIAAFLDRVPDHVTVILDEAYVEMQVLDDPDATVDLLPSTRTSSCCGRSARSTGSPASAAATPSARPASGPPSTPCASRSTSTRSRRRPARRRSCTPTT